MGFEENKRMERIRMDVEVSTEKGAKTFANISGITVIFHTEKTIADKLPYRKPFL